MESKYKWLGIVLSFLLTYGLIDRWEHFYPNINRGYLALMMVAPMASLML